MKYLKNTIVTILTIILLTQIATASTTYYWLTPHQDNQIIDDYPQKISITIQGNTTIQYCNLTIDTFTQGININTQQAEITATQRLPEGTYTTTLNCTDTYGNTQSTKTFQINDMTTLYKNKEKDRFYEIWILAMLILVLVYLTQKEHLYKLLSASAMLVTSILLLVVIKDTLIWIPITITAIIAIIEIPKTL